MLSLHLQPLLLVELLLLSVELLLALELLLVELLLLTMKLLLALKILLVKVLRRRSRDGRGPRDRGRAWGRYVRHSVACARLPVSPKAAVVL